MVAENSTAARFYRWQVPGKPVLIRLSFGVMERIAQEAVRALGSIPRRGAEVGGILLGSAQPGDQAVVKIVDCLPVPCGHCFGPSYILTQEEKRTLEQVLTRWQPLPSRNIYAVGYYRSHTRDDLFMSDEDVWLMSHCFADPSRVALLVKPRAATPSLGGFFFWEDGQIRSAASYLEFPLDRRALGVALVEPEEDVPAAAAEAVTAVEAEAVPETAEEELPPATPLPEPVASQPEPAAPAREPENVPLPSFLQTPQGTRRQGRVWGWKPVLLWVPGLLALVLLGGWLGTQGARLLPLGWPNRTVADPYAMGLAVTEYGDNLHLTWNRDAPAFREAERGILVVGDGDQTRTMELDAAQLRHGSVIYRRQSGPVRFRLELLLKGDRALSEGWAPSAANSAATAPAQ